MVDVLKQLQKASWRGIEFPVEKLDYGFSHEAAEHKFIFKNDSLLQPLGRKNMTWKITIPFTENMAKGGWFSLYTEKFPEFLNAARDSEPGILEVPDLGAFRACVSEMSYSIEPGSMRDGVRVMVTFVHAPEAGDVVDDIEPLLPTIDVAKTMAGAFDAMVGQVEFPPGEEFPEATLDPLSAISSVTDQVSAARDKAKGKIDNAIYKTQQANESVERVGSAKNWAVTRQSNDLQMTLIETRNQVGARGKEIREITTGQSMPLVTLAQEVGTTLAELLRLNGALAKLPLVPANTIVRFVAQ